MQTSTQTDQILSQFNILDNIMEYCYKNNKLPNSHDKTKEIASMGRWLTARKQEQKKGTLDKDLKVAIESKLKDFGFIWVFDQLQEHLQRLEEIEKYCQINNKLPSICSKDKEIASMSHWLSTRKLYQKKGKLDKDLKITIQSKLTDFGFKFE